MSPKESYTAPYLGFDQEKIEKDLLSKPVEIKHDGNTVIVEDIFNSFNIKLVRDVSIDKYHNGYVSFPKGTEITILNKEDNNKYLCTTDIIIDKEQPRVFYLDNQDLGFN